MADDARSCQGATHASAPRTHVGRWLLANATLKPIEVRRELGGKLNSGQAGINVGEPAVIDAACRIALRQIFGEDPHPSEVSDFVDAVRRHAASVDALSPPDIESVVLATLAGDLVGAIGGLSLGRSFAVQSVLFGAACLQLGLDGLAIEAMVVDAEATAELAGWKPPLACDAAP